MKKKYILLIIIILFILGELIAKYILGLGFTPIYITNDKFEYIYAPNQKINRFDNEILVNEYCMRSEPLKENELRILMFGDSVLNGGSLTDHNDLATTLLEKYLEENVSKHARVLNISAGSWGPDNAFAYLEKFGNFNSKIFVLVFSSHDYGDIMTFEPIVGIQESYPDEQPLLAITDGFFRYFIPRIKKYFSSYDQIETRIIKKASKEMNPGWKKFIDYTKVNNIKLIVYLHPEKKEILTGKYFEKGEKIILFLKENNITIIEGVQTTKNDYYRDIIHLNNLGQENLFKIIKDTLSNELNKTKYEN